MMVADKMIKSVPLMSVLAENYPEVIQTPTTIKYKKPLIFSGFLFHYIPIENPVACKIVTIARLIIVHRDCSLRSVLYPH